MIIAYFVHGRGRGHSSRALSVINKLIIRKYSVKTYAGRDAHAVLHAKYKSTWIQSIFPESSPLDFIKRLIHDIRLLKKLKPSVVISDGDAPSVWIARLLHIPVLSIGHGLVFPYCEHSIRFQGWAWIKENIKVRIATLGVNFKFILHFCELPLKDKKSIIVKPDIEILDPSPTNDNYLISYFRDGNGQAVLRQIANSGIEVRNFGQAVNIQGIQNFETDHDNFKRMLSGSRGIISSAGSNVIFEAMAIKKPMLLLYKSTDFEQKANAQYISQLNWGYSCAIEKINLTTIQSYLSSLGTPLPSQTPFDIMPALSDEVLKYMKINLS